MAFTPLFPDPGQRQPFVVSSTCTCTMCKQEFTPNLTHGRATIYREDVERNQVGLYGTWCESCVKVVCDALLSIGALGIEK